MQKRFIVIWFRHLKTDWMIRQQPELKDVPFVLVSPHHGRLRITEVSMAAKIKGLTEGMIAADAQVIMPGIKIFNDTTNLAEKLLNKLCSWCIRFTPVAAVDPPDSLILDVTGCSHLWGSEDVFFNDIINRLKKFGYHIRAAMADTISAAWAMARYGKMKVIKTGEHVSSLLSLTPAALRLDTETLQRLQKLGLTKVGNFIHMQRSVLRRRFGKELLLRLDQATGHEEEFIEPIMILQPFNERLPCLEPIQTATGIKIALQRLLDMLCGRLQSENKGLRTAMLRCIRIDDKVEEIEVSINHASNNSSHLLKLFEYKIETIEPALGIELFILEATKVEDINVLQETFWSANSSLESKGVAELLNNLENKFGGNIIHRYLPDEHHLPERSVKPASSLKEKPAIAWPSDKNRPIQLLHRPEPVDVTAPLPDYPPMNFRYKGRLHTVKKADACERIEPEWWLDGGLHRDYYIVEDEQGKRFWLFRSGHYEAGNKWFIHGFFA